MTIPQFYKAYSLDHNVLRDLGLPTAGKLYLFPVKRNTIFMRIENIGDVFDYEGLNTTGQNATTVQLRDLAERLYAYVN
jgi:hypothetical protein